MSNWNPLEERPKLDFIHVGNTEVHLGDRVRLRPRQGADMK